MKQSWSYAQKMLGKYFFHNGAALQSSYKYILVEQGKIAIRLEDIWHYTNVVDGMLFWIIDETKLVVCSKNAWKVLFS
jgi:hypothetical protein